MNETRIHIADTYTTDLNGIPFLFIGLGAQFTNIMIWTRILVLVLMVILKQSIAHDIRSFTLSIMNEWQFQCATTTCSPYSTIIVSHIRRCQMDCLAQTQCEAASFHQSNLTCQLFENMSNSNITLETATDIITMIVVSGTRTSSGESATMISQDNR